MKETVSKNLEPKFRILGGLVTAIFLILFVRLWVLQIMEGATIMVKSKENQTRVVRVTSPRGFFYDRKGEILVSTRISRNVSAVPEDIKNKPEVITLLSKILQMPTAEIVKKLNPDPKLGHNPYQYVTIKKDIDPTTVIKILEAQMDLPGVEVDEIPLRFYKYGELASHLFGYIREIDESELVNLKDGGYRLGDLIGKNGLEKTYEEYLRGTDGGKIYEVDIYGRRVGKLETKDPEPGNNLHLTINFKVQQAAEQALADHLAYLQKNSKYKNAKSGVAIAIDPRNGDILAMTSKPGYDPNMFVGSLTQEMVDYVYRNPLKPLLNRAIQGEYAPGSTFKPVTVLAALMEHKATIDDRFYCNGYDPVWGKKFKCWVVNSKTASFHGRQSVIDGLKNSCNIVMAELSRRVGVENLAKYSRLLGLGKVTGLNINPAEKPGLVPDREWKRKNTRDKEWYPLETLHFGIGQGYLTVTPLQLAQLYAAIANDGKVYQPRVVSKITNSTGTDLKRFKPKISSSLKIPEEDLAIVKEGLKEVVAGGTAASYFRGFPLDKYLVAGKTGTAQRPPYDDTGVFACYAPANKPEIVVVVFVEQGGSGSGGASPIARKILESYFDLDKKPEVEKPVNVPPVTNGSSQNPGINDTGNPENSQPRPGSENPATNSPVTPVVPVAPGTTAINPEP